MPGKRITEKQADDYMENIEKGIPKKTAALKAGISQRSGRDIAHARRSKERKQREGKPTHEDKFETVMKSFVIPLLKRESPSLHIFLKCFKMSIQANLMRRRCVHFVDG